MKDIVPEHGLSHDFSSLTDSEKAEAKRRVFYLKAIEKNSGKHSRIQDSLIDIASRINDPRPPSKATYYRWLKAYVNSENDIKSLVNNTTSKGNRSNKVHPEIQMIIDEEIRDTYLKAEKPSIAHLERSIAARVAVENRFRDQSFKLTKPAYITVYNRVRQLDHLTVSQKRYGRYKARSIFGTFKEGPRSSYPLERVEIDHTKLDIFVIDDEGFPIGRPWLTVAIDHFSRSVLGFYIGFYPPSSMSVMECLRHAIPRKHDICKRYTKLKNSWEVYGKPRSLIVDNGMEFKSSHFEEACLDLGIQIQYCPPMCPWFKGMVERFFGTLNKKLIHNQRGSTFSNIRDRGDYDPTRNASLSFSDLISIMHIWVVDIYQQSYHRGISTTPAALWSKAIEDVSLEIPSLDELDIILGLTATRTIRKTGIELKGLFYNSQELGRLRLRSKLSEKVTVKYDPNDLSKIYVLDKERSCYFSVLATNQEYAKGKTHWQHDAIRSRARKGRDRVDYRSLIEAEEEIRAIAQGSRKRQKTKTALKEARLKGIHQTVQRERLEKESLDEALKKRLAQKEDPDLEEFYVDDDDWHIDFSLGRAQTLL